MITTDISSDTVFKLAVAFNRNSQPEAPQSAVASHCSLAPNQTLPSFPFSFKPLSSFTGGAGCGSSHSWSGSASCGSGALTGSSERSSKCKPQNKVPHWVGPRHPTQHLLDVPKSESAYCGPFKSGLESCGCVWHDACSFLMLSVHDASTLDESLLGG